MIKLHNPLKNLSNYHKLSWTPNPENHQNFTLLSPQQKNIYENCLQPQISSKLKPNSVSQLGPLNENENK